ncbi:hypothetical protein D1614_22550 [Maribellus luteus]|uniref:Uncharacterized protein n=1 Tax=Maribellus luteus TaxID=2305463 RepID=A0A399SRP1_9BACT|nr:hypothetical protein D1614_22550 [Maribellus luteus]
MFVIYRTNVSRNLKKIIRIPEIARQNLLSPFCFHSFSFTFFIWVYNPFAFLLSFKTRSDNKTWFLDMPYVYQFAVFTEKYQSFIG